MNLKTSRLRKGFTLTELLLVITIMLTLAAMSLGVMRSAQEDARAAGTESRILTIEMLLLQEMEEYQVRRLPISNDLLTSYVMANRLSSTVPVGVQVKNLRRRIMADIIRSEMAGWYLADSTDPTSFANSPDLGVFPTRNTSALASPYGSPFTFTFFDWLNDQYPNPVGGLLLSELLEQDRYVTGRIRYWRRFNGDVTFDLPGEYLYQILAQIDADGVSGVEVLGPSAVSDTDGDGHPEIVDAWGESMQLRTLQVALDFTNSTPAGDIYQDAAILNWDLENTNPAPIDSGTALLPVGYDVINPTIPRSINKIRVQVVSPTFDSYTK